MTDSQKLIIIKAIHTIVWFSVALMICFIFYSGLVNQINIYTWISIGLVALEGIVLLAFKWVCPLTILARKYSDSTKDNFDIYLPNWLAKHNKFIFTTIFVLGIGMVIFRIVPQA